MCSGGKGMCKRTPLVECDVMNEQKIAGVQRKLADVDPADFHQCSFTMHLRVVDLCHAEVG